MANIILRAFIGLFLCLTQIELAYARVNSSAVGVLRPLTREDIEKINPSGASKRDADDFSVFDPVKSDNFMWGNPSDDSTEFAFVNMTMFTNDGERIISLDRFAPMLESVKCGERMTLAFKDKKGFEYATKTWGWVNENEDHSFILITDHESCSPEDQRQPFQINDVDYDEKNNIAYLVGVEKEWKEVAHDIDLTWGRFQMPQDVTRRDIGDWNQEFPLDMKTDLNPLGVDTDSFSLKCIDCGSKGQFHVAAAFRLREGEIAEASLEVRPQGLRADLGLQFEKKSTTGPLSESYSPTFLEIPLPWPRLMIPGIIGLEGVVKAGASIGMKELSQKTTIEFGMSAVIPDDALFFTDLANTDRNQFSGWEVDFERKPFKVSTKAKGAVTAAPLWFVGIDFDLFKWEFNAGFQLKFPEATLSVDGFGTPGTTCPNEGKQDGTSVGFSIGAAVNFAAGSSAGKDVSVGLPALTSPIWEVKEKRSLDSPSSNSDLAPETHVIEKRKNIFLGGSISVPILSVSKLLWETCLPPVDGEIPAPPPPPPGVPPPKEEPPCEVDGKKGICKHTGLGCANGHFNPGKGPNWPCNGDQDIQCCIGGDPAPPPPSEPEYCNVGGGAAGVCQDISKPCADGYYDPGQPPDWPCSGSKNVQCCIKGTPPPPPPGRCEVGGKHGTCRNTKEGCPRGYFDPGTGPDWPCKGDQNTQCCIPGHAPTPPNQGLPPGQCKIDHGTGKCSKASNCRGISYDEPLCPNDPADVQCCVEVPCEGVDPQALPWIQPPPRFYGFCKRASDGCANKDPPLPLDPNPVYKFIEPVGRDFLCPGGQDIKCCVNAS